MGISCVALVFVEGKPIAKLNKLEIERISEQWANTLIMYVVGQNSTINAMNAFMKSQWSMSSSLVIYKHEEGYFIVKLGFEEDRDSIIYVRPHLFFGKPLIIIKQWTTSFDLNKEVLKVIPI